MTYSDSGMREELSFALDICEKAGAIAMKYFRRGVSADTKSDGSPVTIADRENERLIREALAAKFPDDAILGEEEGETAARNASSKKRRWIIDPIDGTYGFTRGSPIFSILLALEEDGVITMGVLHAPAAGETYWADKGRGAYFNGRKIRVSNISRLADAQMNFGALERVLHMGLWEGFTNLVKATTRQRGYGDYLSFAYVFDGRSELVVEVGVKPWDLAPMKIIVEEAGGKFTDLTGGSSIASGSCVISNGLVHDRALKILMENAKLPACAKTE